MAKYRHSTIYNTQYIKTARKISVGRNPTGHKTHTHTHTNIKARLKHTGCENKSCIQLEHDRSSGRLL